MREKPEQRFDRLMKAAPPLTIPRFVEAIMAAHLSSSVGGYTEDRGGIILVGPPGALKSTVVTTLSSYTDCLVLTDLNVQALVDLRDNIAGGSISTLVFPEMAKIYERHPTTALNLEGSLRSMVAEGFRSASFEDSRINRAEARCFIIGALTPHTQTKNFKRWEETGFSRRFLWPVIHVDQKKLEEAVARWKAFDLRTAVPPLRPDGNIPAVRTRSVAKMARILCQHQPGGSNRTLQMAILVRMYAVLCWHYKRYRRKADPLKTWLAFGRALGRTGTRLVISKTEQRG